MMPADIAGHVDCHGGHAGVETASVEMAHHAGAVGGLLQVGVERFGGKDLHGDFEEFIGRDGVDGVADEVVGNFLGGEGCPDLKMTPAGEAGLVAGKSTGIARIVDEFVLNQLAEHLLHILLVEAGFVKFLAYVVATLLRAGAQRGHAFENCFCGYGFLLYHRANIIIIRDISEVWRDASDYFDYFCILKYDPQIS